MLLSQSLPTQPYETIARAPPRLGPENLRPAEAGLKLPNCMPRLPEEVLLQGLCLESREALSPVWNLDWREALSLVCCLDLQEPLFPEWLFPESCFPESPAEWASFQASAHSELSQGSFPEPG
jgi:hypothetical protein